VNGPKGTLPAKPASRLAEPAVGSPVAARAEFLPRGGARRQGKGPYCRESHSA
jgi:hypothetical protein